MHTESRCQLFFLLVEYGKGELWTWDFGAILGCVLGRQAMEGRGLGGLHLLLQCRHQKGCMQGRQGGWEELLELVAVIGTQIMRPTVLCLVFSQVLKLRRSSLMLWTNKMAHVLEEKVAVWGPSCFSLQEARAGCQIR